MPNRAKGARLHWRSRKDGPGVWEIRDTGTRPISTRTQCREEAEKELAEYISRKARPSGPAAPHELSIAWALTIYADEHAPHTADPARVGYAIDALDSFWGDRPVSDITGRTCRRYAADRKVSPSTARRELGVLQAAVNYCDREGYLTSAPKVTLPPKAEVRERWLTRQEVAWLIRAARALNRDGRHLQWFILDGVNTGSRKATILAMHLGTPSTIGGDVNLETGVMHRSPIGAKETKKRRRSARLPDRYLAHLRRRAARGALYVVERRLVVDGVEQRAMVRDIKKAWARAVSLAQEMAEKQGIELDLTFETPQGPKPIVPHILKHTAITWALQGGATIWDAAGYFSTSPETIQRVYGHHCPDHQSTAVAAAGVGIRAEPTPKPRRSENL